MYSILVCSTRENAIQIIEASFQKPNRVKAVHTWQDCLVNLEGKQFDFLFIDADFFETLENIKGYKDLLNPFLAKIPTLEIVILTTKDTIRRAVNLVKAGASDYLTFPLDPVEINFVVEAILHEQQVYSEIKYLRDHFWHRDSYAILKTNSTKMQEVFQKVRAVAPTESTVLLLGETGTGKGVIANLIHRHSPRADKQFIQIHCGAISDSIQESELFGHEKGSFTGATRQKLGKFELANNGTIFLDEIGTISPAMQVNLLQVLQYRSFQRVGGESDIQVNVRLIAATNADLQKLTKEGFFRQDLFFRLNVFPIVIPPLRDRKEDIPLLVETFLGNLNQKSSKRVKEVDPVVLDVLKEYDWPGNIRELENVIERAFVLSDSKRLTEDCLPAELVSVPEVKCGPSVDSSLTLEEARKQALESIEKTYLVELLMQHGGRIDRSASVAGIGVRQLHKLLTKYHINKTQFKNTPSRSSANSEQ